MAQDIACHLERRQQLLNSPRCTAKDIGITPSTGCELDHETISLIEDIDGYLSDFAKPVKRENGEGTGFLFGDILCISCGKPLSGILGTFAWGIAHGEGTCSACGWPTRFYHNILDRKGNPFFTSVMQFPLQYHPDKVTISA